MSDTTKQKAFVISNISRISRDTKLNIGKYILLYEGEQSLTQCANAVAMNLDKMSKSTISNIYAMVYNSL